MSPAVKVGYSPHIDKVWWDGRMVRRARLIATQGHRWRVPTQTPARGSRTSVLARQARLICGGPR